VAARQFAAAGARIVAVSDSEGGIFRDKGLDLDAVTTFKATHGTVVGLPDTRSLTNEALLELDCDILIPAALGGQIHRVNADSIKARLIVEAANGPTTPAADDILMQKGVVVLPDILANAGGVCVSYFEWVQNYENEQWDLEDINRKLRRKIDSAVDAVVARWNDLQAGQSSNADADQDGDAATESTLLNLRTAAMVLAVGRVADVTLERGIWP